MPQPDAVVADWIRALMSRGVLSVVFWPRTIDGDGPGAVIRRLLEKRFPPPDVSWQDRLVPSIRAAGAEILADRAVSFAQSHESAAAYFDAMVAWGPMRVQLLRHGEPLVRELRAEFLADSAPGPLVQQTT